MKFHPDTVKGRSGLKYLFSVKINNFSLPFSELRMIPMFIVQISKRTFLAWGKL